jgi:hypothetical protein
VATPSTAGHAEQGQEGGVHVGDERRLPAGGAEAVVDHLLEGIRNRQRGAGGDQQGDPGQQELAR